MANKINDEIQMDERRAWIRNINGKKLNRSSPSAEKQQSKLNKNPIEFTEPPTPNEMSDYLHSILIDTKSHIVPDIISFDQITNDDNSMIHNERTVIMLETMSNDLKNFATNRPTTQTFKSKHSNNYNIFDIVENKFDWTLPSSQPYDNLPIRFQNKFINKVFMTEDDINGLMAKGQISLFKGKLFFIGSK